MNCNDFAERLQRCLDDRLPPNNDDSLLSHARQCDACRGQLEAWERIADVIAADLFQPSAEHSADSRRNRSLTASGLAAAVLLAILLQSVWRGGPAGPVGIDSRATAMSDNDSQQPVAQQHADSQYVADPAGWWQDMRDRDWVAQTMPAVRGVREGVAPLGRSLLRAVTILTIGGERHT